MGNTRLPDNRDASSGLCGAHQGSPAHVGRAAGFAESCPQAENLQEAGAQPRPLAWPPEQAPPWGRRAPATVGLSSEKRRLPCFRPPCFRPPMPAWVRGVCTGGGARPVLRVCRGERGAALNCDCLSLCRGGGRGPGPAGHQLPGASRGRPR